MANQAASPPIRPAEWAGWAVDGAVLEDDSRGFAIREVRYRRSPP